MSISVQPWSNKPSFFSTRQLQHTTYPKSHLSSKIQWLAAALLLPNLSVSRRPRPPVHAPSAPVPPNVPATRVPASAATVPLATAAPKCSSWIKTTLAQRPLFINIQWITYYTFQLVKEPLLVAVVFNQDTGVQALVELLKVQRLIDLKNAIWEAGQARLPCFGGLWLPAESLCLLRIATVHWSHHLYLTSCPLSLWCSSYQC